MKHIIFWGICSLIMIIGAISQIEADPKLACFFGFVAGITVVFLGASVSILWDEYKLGSRSR